MPATQPATQKDTAAACSICGAPVPAHDEAGGPFRYRPFCSARCQKIDLGNWLGERYSVPAQGSPDDDEEGEGASPAARPGDDEPG